jgi:hypothetical protein
LSSRFRSINTSINTMQASSVHMTVLYTAADYKSRVDAEMVSGVRLVVIQPLCN